MNAPTTFPTPHLSVSEAEGICWTDQPEARAIIMAIVADGNPVVTSHSETFVQTRDEWRVFHGELPAALEMLRETWIDAHLDQRANWGRVPTVAQAIDRAWCDPAVIPAWMAERLVSARRRAEGRGL